jgi:cytochrome c oxidase subunit 1
MTTTAAAVTEEPHLHYLNESYGVRSWLLTTDHKRVGLLYLISLTAVFFLSGFLLVEYLKSL